MLGMLMPLKNWEAPCNRYMISFCVTRPQMKISCRVSKNNKKNEKKDEENGTKKYLPLPVRCKRNVFANRVGQRASIMRNQYFVNVPVDGNIYVKKKKNRKLKKPTESGKRTQQQPLMPHFTNPQPTGKQRQLSPTEDEVPPTKSFKKTKHQSSTKPQATHPPMKPTTNQQTTTNQANSQQN